MDVELFVHGVPSGEGFWGKEDDRNYFGTFYDHSSDEIKFLIQTRILKGKVYCYYNYLVYKTVGATAPNIVANDGRDGSYFGITLRLDAYCKDFVNMFRILDTVYNVYIIGTLLKMEKTKLKYMTPDFASASKQLEEIEKTTITLIQNAFSNDSFTRLEGFTTNGGNCPSYNLYDCTPEKVMSTVKQCGRAALSPYYQSVKEVSIQQQCNAQVQTIQQQYEARIKADAEKRAKEKDEINQTLSSTKSQLSQLQHEMEKKDGTINELNNEITRLQSEIKRNGQNKKVAQIVAPIKQPIAELAKVLKSLAPEPANESVYHQNDGEHGNRHESIFTKIMKFVNHYISPIMLLAIVALILLKPFSKDSNDKILSKIDIMERGIDELQEQFVNKDMPEYSMAQSTTTNTPKFVISSVQIDIKNYISGDLSKYKTYDVEAKNGTDNGEWKVEGGELRQTEDPKKVQITPTKDKLKIMYCVGDQTKSRELTAK